MCPFIIWLHCHSRYSSSIEGHDISFAAWYYIKQTMLCFQYGVIAMDIKLYY